MLVGTIGTARREYLYDLQYKDIVVILRGYNARKRDLWSATRWQTYNLMASFSGSKSLANAGIRSPKDLLEFPWEQERQPEVSQEDVDELRSLISNINKKGNVPDQHPQGQG